MPTGTERNERRTLLDLLEIKDSDIRIATLEQGHSAVDRGIHIGGAFSAVVPLVSLFYGGFLELDVSDPTRPGQDIFVLSKGHAIAALASIYADLGYFPADILRNSRSVDSVLNGHPGPILPGVHVATGPLGQGLAVAQGFAMAGRSEPQFDVYCMTGDGELQQGVVWEAFMHAPAQRLDNLCVLIDKNEGQLDDSSRLTYPMDDVPAQIESFGWNVRVADGTSYDSVLHALEERARQPRDGRPTAIICNTVKGHGAFSEKLFCHKITLTDELFEQEKALQDTRRAARERRLFERGGDDRTAIPHGRMGYVVDTDRQTVTAKQPDSRSGTVPSRDKRIAYDAEHLPRYERGRRVSAAEVVAESMRVFARDRRVVSVDADLSSTSGLLAGVGAIDRFRAHNVGIAESNMMCIGEAYAALGFNVWVSTFCPFFDWKVMRRIAVGMQERTESMEDPDGWLSDGHGVDLTFLATASNLETRANGATHMGNDDAIVFSAIAGVRVIDVSCPNQLVSVMRWVMDGNRGLTYIRIMRAPSAVLYDPGHPFEFGKAVRLHGDDRSAVNLVSSGRGVHEACGAAALLKEHGVSTAVYDFASFDGETMTALLNTDAITVIAEQNNGYLWNELGRMVLHSERRPDLKRVCAINTTRRDGRYQFIHSATYDELTERFGLSSERIASRVLSLIDRQS